MRIVLLWLWPSFLVAGVAEGVFFSLFDPADLHLFGEPVQASAIAIYTLGFLGFWAVAAISAALTLFTAQGWPATGD